MAQKPLLTKPAETLLAECGVPQHLPEAGLTIAEVEFYWLRDRAALLDCGAMKQALQDYYTQRDRALAGNNGRGR